MFKDLHSPPDLKHLPLLEKCFVSMPFGILHRHLEMVTQNRIQPEIILEGEALYSVSQQDFATVAHHLVKKGLACTLHAPFADLSPGAADLYIRRVTVHKLKRALRLVEIFKPRAVVCHMNFEPHKHNYKLETWFENTLQTWRELLPMVRKHGTLLLLENTYETDPDIHRRLFEEVADPNLGFCLDVGHLVAFARSDWRDWLPTLTPWLRQLHLHDNHGDRDAHLPIGYGSFDFQGLFQYLGQQGLKPIVTLEPHTKKGLVKSLEAIDSMGLFNGIV